MFDILLNKIWTHHNITTPLDHENDSQIWRILESLYTRTDELVQQDYS